MTTFDNRITAGRALAEALVLKNYPDPGGTCLAARGRSAWS